MSRWFLSSLVPLSRKCFQAAGPARFLHNLTNPGSSIGLSESCRRLPMGKLQRGVAAVGILSALVGGTLYLNPDVDKPSEIEAYKWTNVEAMKNDPIAMRRFAEEVAEKKRCGGGDL